ncbi:MAG TPA: tetratricopeptide repeat protein [Pseudolabrys sp.]|nr:tetratricopeptide repeat protein [Pseudolabrys sp.]
MILKRTRGVLHGLLFLGIAAYASALSSMGLHAQAIAWLRSAMRRFPEHASMFDSQLASAYERAGRLDEAIRCLEAAIRTGPDSDASCWELAILYEKHGRADLALVNFEKSLELGPAFSEEFRHALKSKIGQLRSARGRVDGAW